MSPKPWICLGCGAGMRRELARPAKKFVDTLVRPDHRHLTIAHCCGNCKAFHFETPDGGLRKPRKEELRELEKQLGAVLGKIRVTSYPESSKPAGTLVVPEPARKVNRQPPIPYTTETLAQLQARYPLALEAVYDQVAIEHHGAIRPGEVAAQVFDTDGGTRLIVSREKSADGKVMLHVSASIRSGSRIGQVMQLQMAENPGREQELKISRMWKTSIPTVFAKISQDLKPLVFTGWSKEGVPHWHRDEG